MGQSLVISVPFIPPNLPPILSSILTESVMMIKLISSCLFLSLTMSSPVPLPKPQPFGLPLVTGAFSLTLPTITFPGIAVAAPAIAGALAAKGLLAGGFAGGALLRSLVLDGRKQEETSGEYERKSRKGKYHYQLLQ